MRAPFSPFLAMLNRRTLRIKIMQSLFAKEQGKEADYQLALEHIHTIFSPDLNSMKVQDKDLLKGQRSVAVKLFEKKFKGEAVKESADPKIEQTVEESLVLYHKLIKKDFEYFRKMVVQDTERVNVFYHLVLDLLTVFAKLAAEDKKISAKNLLSNPIIKALKENSDLRNMILRSGGGWEQRTTLVKGWFRDCVKADKEFQGYLEAEAPDLEAHKTIVKHIARKLILGNTPVNAWFEEQDLHWAEDHEIVRSMFDKTLKSFDVQTSRIELQKLSLDWDDDLEFIQTLFNAAGQLDDNYHQLIAAHTRNWEVDRLPLTDRVILQMAIAEMINFPNIPVKVTINEYIEIAKHYSTPKSRPFINGILDVIAKELKQTGKIKKSGRGLMDNK